MIVIGGENLIDLVSSSSNSEGLPIYLANPGGSPYNVAIATSKFCLLYTSDAADES